MSNIQLFNFESHEVRTVVIDGNPWFVAKDVCDILEISDVSMTVSRLKDYEKLIQILFVSGQNRDVLVISESGLYRLLMTSRKPNAEPFQDWLAQEVIPSIRKTGSYSVNQQPQLQLPPGDIRARDLKETLQFFDIDSTNPRFKQEIQDMVGDMLGLNKEALPESTDRWCGVAERAEELGYPVGLVTKNRSQLGKYIKANSDDLELRQEKRLCNGTQRSINLYKVCDDLDYLIIQFMDAKVLAS